jgi:nondiscriminating aspartyl-tRNA synthetase
MERTLIKETIKKIGEKVKIEGYVHVVRAHGKIAFADIVDRSGVLQVVGESAVADLRSQYAVEIEGIINPRPEKMFNDKIETGKVELSVEKVTVLSKSDEMPFDMGAEELNLELPTLLDFRSLTLRHSKIKAIFKVEEVVIDAFRRALKEKDFFEFQAPSIIPAIPEGGSEVFKVKYFDYEAYLSQSPQLYKSLLVGAFERVFSVNKVFRAEPSVTTTHITEFMSLDAEMGFIESWLDVKDMTEYVIKFIMKEVNEKCSKELELYNAKIPQIPESVPTLKMREAQQMIFERTGRDVRTEKDLAPEDEREICKWALEEKGSDVVFVSHYPTKTRPFYTYPDPENPDFNQGFDLLGRGREWLTGGRRINNYETLLNHVKEWGIKPEKIKLYLDAFKYGMPPLGGFAFGAERITMFILGLKNIREASLFPRDMERIDTRLSQKEEKSSK